MDRFSPIPMGRRRGWILLAQLALLALTFGLAGLGDNPDAPFVLFALGLAIAFASATQDIAIDAYAVDVLHQDEQGVAVGARTALYRAAMFVAGGLAITLTGMFSWPLVCIGLAAMYLPMLLLTLRAPEPEEPLPPPRSLRDAIWLPFLEFLSRHQALPILAFVLLYKLSDNLAQSLLRPFLKDMGYDSFHRGVALATLGIVFTLAGTFLGGALTGVISLGRSLWLFGFLQIFSNVGYILVASAPVNLPLMYGAMSFENFTTGLGMGAFGVLLLRMTRKRFSATQYALFSSLFGLPRILAGPVSGYTVHALGWTNFFWFTMAAGIPGMILLARFVPWSVREPEFHVKALSRSEPLTGPPGSPGCTGAGQGISGNRVPGPADAVPHRETGNGARLDRPGRCVRLRPGGRPVHRCRQHGAFRRQQG
jgi:PAT family beta-lactamase induction signal transducer AmpG